MYVIGQEDVYLAYIKTKPGGNSSEFANSTNDHKYDLAWQLQQFPRLRPVIEKVMTGDTDVKTRLTFSPPSEDELKQLVSKDAWALEYVPEELITPELCKIAVSQNGWVLQHVPKELRTPELCKIAVSENARALDFVPEDLRTPELCKIAVSQNGWVLRYVPPEILQRHPELREIASS